MILFSSAGSFARAIPRLWSIPLFALSIAYFLHSSRMCGTVKGTPHVSHVLPPVLKCSPWVIRVWPMRRRVKARCSTWIDRSFPAIVFGLIRRRKTSRQPDHSLSHVSRILSFTQRSASCFGTGMLAGYFSLARLAAASAKSLPAMPQ